MPRNPNNPDDIDLYRPRHAETITVSTDDLADLITATRTPEDAAAILARLNTTQE